MFGRNSDCICMIFRSIAACWRVDICSNYDNDKQHGNLRICGIGTRTS